MGKVKFTIREQQKPKHSIYASHVSTGTHLYGTGSLKSGNSFGVDTRWVRSHCRRFYHIGNDDIHRRDPIMKMPHQRLSFDWLVTRGDSSKARIYVWENKNF